MKLLEERILKDGQVKPGNVLKVDGFLNHQIDTALVSKLADEWYGVFGDLGVTKILTIDGSGIGIAAICALRFGAPMLIARKINAQSKVANDCYSTKVVSFTHGHEYYVLAKKDYISKDDKILIIDDFLANGSAMKALISLCKIAGAEVIGCGVAIEKIFAQGGNDIRRMGYKVESLAKISSISDDGKIEFC